jgi:hypothetical protein
LIGNKFPPQQFEMKKIGGVQSGTECEELEAPRFCRNVNLLLSTSRKVPIKSDEREMASQTGGKQRHFLSNIDKVLMRFFMSHERGTPEIYGVFSSASSFWYECLI